MRKLFIIAAICLTGCNTKEDKIPFAVFDAVIVAGYNEHVYIDLDSIKDYRAGDTVEVDDNGFINDGYWVVLDKRLPVDTLINITESGE